MTHVSVLLDTKFFQKYNAIMFNLNGVYANVEQAVVLLGVTKSYVTRLIREKRIAAIRVGREWLIPVTDGKVNVLPKQKQ